MPNPLIVSAIAVNTMKPVRQSHPVLVVRIFMNSALIRRITVVPASPACPGRRCQAALSSDRRLSRGELEERGFQVRKLRDELMDDDACPQRGVADRDRFRPGDVRIAVAVQRHNGLAAEHGRELFQFGRRTRVRLR